MNEFVLINDVGPRDGLQNQSCVLTPAQRLRLITTLADAGIKAIEMGAFVSPKAVPAMAGSDLVAAGLVHESNIDYSALIPNHKGYQLATAAGIRTVNLVVAASNTMNKENIRLSTTDAVAMCKEVIVQANRDLIKTQVYIATAWECPFEGRIAAARVIDLTAQLMAAGAAGIVIADTIGAANPATVKTLLQPLIAEYGAQRFTCHFHDTRAMGLANIYAALEVGIRNFDAAIGGLGGCPFAPGASGNVATEDVALMLDQMGFDTGINLRQLVVAADLATELTGSCTGGHAIHWLKRSYQS
ncbi:MAG: hydroxymethylglutaryl-CoA lyase [Pseudomonadales bacterium]